MALAWWNDSESRALARFAVVNKPLIEVHSSGLDIIKFARLPLALMLTHCIGLASFRLLRSYGYNQTKRKKSQHCRLESETYDLFSALSAYFWQHGSQKKLICSSMYTFSNNWRGQWMFYCLKLLYFVVSWNALCIDYLCGSTAHHQLWLVEIFQQPHDSQNLFTRFRDILSPAK